MSLQISSVRADMPVIRPRKLLLPFYRGTYSLGRPKSPTSFIPPSFLSVMEEIDSSNIPSAPCLQMLIFPEETEMDAMLIQATSNEEEITCAQLSAVL